MPLLGWSFTTQRPTSTFEHGHGGVEKTSRARAARRPCDATWMVFDCDRWATAPGSQLLLVEREPARALLAAWPVRRDNRQPCGEVQPRVWSVRSVGFW